MSGSKTLLRGDIQLNSGELLIEVGCEEIPSRFLAEIYHSMATMLDEFLTASGIAFGRKGPDLFTSRRLTYVYSSVPFIQPDKEITLTGPPEKLGFDTYGNPTQAVISFAERNKLKVKDLAIISTPKGKYVAAKIIQKGIPTVTLIKKRLAQVILSLPLPRTMHWASAKDPHFIRPIRWLCCVFDGKSVRFQFGDIKSNGVTTGHRIISPRKFGVKNLAQYRRDLLKHGVVIDPEKRRIKIESESKFLVSNVDGTLLNDNELIETHIHLTEHPTAIIGSFDTTFLNLPQEILVTVMRDHQKYFSILDRKGHLLPKFLAIIDNVSDRRGLIRHNHERVLKARLTDAEFFWQMDQRIHLRERRSMLERVVFQDRLGSYAEKTRRLEQIISWLIKESRITVNEEQARLAAQLCKCDLTTQMVKEFPELQGVVGGLYAEVQGEPPEVAHAIYEHYQPMAQESDIPKSLLGGALSITDKLDSIVGSFVVGERPSGSKDPFGLRRQAYGIIKVLLYNNISIDLKKLTQYTFNLILSTVPIDINDIDAEEMMSVILGFFRDHLRSVLSGLGTNRSVKVHRDEVEAVMASDCWDLCDLYLRLRALHEARLREDFESLAASFKRIKNIIRKSGVTVRREVMSVCPDLFEQIEEMDLYQGIEALKSQVKPFREAQNYEAVLGLIAGIRPTVDRFFDKVLVNAENEVIRENRFNLLLSLYQLFIQTADFSELQSANLRT